jgi:heat shock protein HtpX
VERRFSTRDAGLAIRMVIALVLVATFYAAIAAAILGLTRIHNGGWRAGTLIGAAVILGVAVTHVRQPTKTLVRATGAQPVREDQPLSARLVRLASFAEIPAPALYMIESEEANAFTAGTRAASTVLVVTRGLVKALEQGELDAVLAHELSHVANRDAAVLTAASVPRVIGDTLLGRNEPNASFFWFFVWWIGLPIWAIGSLLTLTLSRYREFAADRGSAILTGRPEALMSALTKLEGHEIPTADLRSFGAAEAFCIVPTGATRFTWLRDHPPLEKRLAALSQIAREMGRPVA